MLKNKMVKVTLYLNEGDLRFKLLAFAQKTFAASLSRAPK
ncbi:hypothetical protein ABH968_001834 [Lysinibacillus sp. RC79]